METMGSLRRTNYCGEVSMSNVGQEMTVCGSIARARDKGGIIFADLRDTTGILQLVFDEDTPKDVFAKAESLKSEYVVICRGLLRERAAKTTKIATGDVELYVSELRILSEAQTPPFEIRDDINVNDDLRLRYRYLDLRRPSMHEPIVLRSKIMQIIRSYFCDNHFTEIETPTLIKSTPEGARDYLVPSRVQPGHFYALPQSPQLYKQILMLSGFDRYFQIARCFRDEDLRADRQPEFTQIDLEMSFVDVEDLHAVGEGFMAEVFRRVLGKELPLPLPRLTYDESMRRYGSDKPDTRFAMELTDLTDTVRDCGFGVFSTAALSGGAVGCITAKAAAEQVFIQVGTGGGIPEAAGIRADLVSQNDGAVRQAAKLQFEVNQADVGIQHDLLQHFVDLEGVLGNGVQLFLGGKVKGQGVIMVDERVMQVVVLVAVLQDGGLEHLALGHAHAQAEVAGGNIADDDFQRNDLNLLDQGIAVVQLLNIMGGDAFFFQLLHQSVGQLVVDNALIADGALLFAVAGGGIVLVMNHNDFGVRSCEYLLSFAFVHLFFNFNVHCNALLYILS